MRCTLFSAEDLTGTLKELHIPAGPEQFVNDASLRASFSPSLLNVLSDSKCVIADDFMGKLYGAVELVSGATR